MLELQPQVSFYERCAGGNHEPEESHGVSILSLYVFPAADYAKQRHGGDEQQGKGTIYSHSARLMTHFVQCSSACLACSRGPNPASISHAIILLQGSEAGRVTIKTKIPRIS